MRTSVYFVIYDWMIHKMDLTKTNLTGFAVTYSYFKNEGVKVTEDELSNCLGISRRQSRHVLLELFKKGFVLREKILGDVTAKYCYYPNMNFIKSNIFNYG